jgi:outer membrane receptor protein involved in Fe transport
MKLMPENTELKTQVIKSARITNTEASVINEIKSSSNVVSGTSAAQISKTMDRNAAEVVKRIPGVTIQDDKFIVIRGLPDRYNTVWLNDAATPSSESDKRAFSFDIIPAGLIDRIMVFKTPSPELPGDFAGGMVKIYTTSIADKNQFTVSVQTSSREFTTGSAFNYQNTGKTDWLGYDDGKRNIPSVIPSSISTKDPNYKDNIGAWSKSFGNDWQINSKTASPDMRLSLSSTNVIKFKNVKIGNTFGVAYANTSTVNNIHRQDWDSVSKSYNYDDNRSMNTVNAGIMDNLGIAFGNSKIEFKNLYNQVGTSGVTLRNTVIDSFVTSTPEKSYLLWYDSKATYTSQLTGTHKNNSDTRKYTWTLGYANLFRNQPDRRILKYAQAQNTSGSPESTYYQTPLPSSPDILNGGRFYASLFENQYSFYHQFTQKVTIKDYSFELNAGDYLEYKSRAFNIRQFGYTIRRTSANAYMLTLPVDQIFADSNVDGNKNFKIGEITHDYDHYSAENKLITGFLSAKLPYKNFNVSGGVRYEYNVQSLVASRNYDTLTPAITTKFFLPSVNASYNFSEKSLIRAAYGKTLNRPEFREWAPIFYYDFDDLAGYKGSLFQTTANPNGDTLKVAQIQNFDVRYELYPAPGEMIQIGGFYKSFRDPITRIIAPGGASGDSKTFTFINADKAYCLGLEFDIRKNLGWLDSKLGTGFFKDLTLVGNLSLVKSNLTIDTTHATGVNHAIPSSTLQGQAPYIINAGLFYQNEDNGLQASALYNIAGPRMYALGTIEAEGASIGEMPFRSLDVVVTKTFFKHVMLNIGLQNLLGGRVLFMKDSNRDNKFDAKDDRDFRSYYPGRYYSVGVKIKF